MIIEGLSGIRTRNPSDLAAADLRTASGIGCYVSYMGCIVNPVNKLLASSNYLVRHWIANCLL